MAALLAGALGITLSSAQAAELKVGDPAPKLQTGEWIQGDPVKEFAADKAFPTSVRSSRSVGNDYTCSQNFGFLFIDASLHTCSGLG